MSTKVTKGTRVTEDGEVVNYTDYETTWIKPPQWKTPWNHDTSAESLATGTECRDPSKTQQSHMADADINNILRKFSQTGELPVTGIPQYMDIEEEFDLQERIVTQAEMLKAWEALPAVARNSLKDPQTFLAYIDHCRETGDLAPLVELGLADDVTPRGAPLQRPKAASKPPEGGGDTPDTPPAAAGAPAPAN